MSPELLGRPARSLLPSHTVEDCWFRNLISTWQSCTWRWEQGVSSMLGILRCTPSLVTTILFPPGYVEWYSRQRGGGSGHGHARSREEGPWGWVVIRTWVRGSRVVQACVCWVVRCRRHPWLAHFNHTAILRGGIAMSGDIQAKGGSEETWWPEVLLGLPSLELVSTAWQPQFFFLFSFLNCFHLKIRKTYNLPFYPF